MAQTELHSFIDAAKRRGAGDEFLASLLIRRGWQPAEVYDVLAGWWEGATGVAVPSRGRAAENSRDAFLYLLAFSTLAIWASALGSLWFRLIEYWLPDTLAPHYYNFRGTVTWQMAAIAVALPAYLLVMRVILRETRANPDRVESGVRKWLTYIALLLAAIGVVSDLICFMQYFLAGGLTLRFVLKCLVVLAICGSIFWYYLGFLRGRVQNAWFGGFAAAAAVAGFAFGLAVAGTPAIQRQLEADNRRVQDLRSLAGVLSAMPELPATLDGVSKNRPALRVADPDGKLYEYSAKSPKEYELCATFTAASTEETGSGFWGHGKGRACFAFEVSRPVPW